MSREENMQIKMVPFMGTELAALKEPNGQIWAGVKWLCEGIGLSDGQIKSERLKIQHDFVLNKGGRNFVLPTKGGNQEALCLKLDYVPLWLAKINITPKMREETPELAQRLEEYQLKAKDVLAAAFLPEKLRNGGKPMTDHQKASIEIQKMRLEIQEQTNHIKRAKMLEEMSKKYAGHTFEQVLDAHATKELVGEFLIPLPEIGRKTYSAEEVGKRYGITAHAVGRIANANGLKTDKYGSWFADKAKHAQKEVNTFRYFDSVFPEIEKALGEKGGVQVG